MGALSPAHDEAIALLAGRALEYLDEPSARHRVAAPVFLDEATLAADVSGIRRLCALVDLLPELAFAGDRLAFADFHGIPPQLTDLLDAEGETATWFARPDCVLSDGHLRVLELNIGTGSVNLAAGVASNLYFAGATPLPEVRSALAGRYHIADWSADEAFAAKLAEFGRGEPVGLWYHGPPAEVRPVVENICHVVGAHDVPAVPVHTADIESFAGPLYACFATARLFGPDGEEAARVFRWAAGRPDRALARPGDVLRTAKTNLALLHGLAVRGELDAADAEIVLRHVPETRLADDARADPRIRRRKDDWVIKPDISFQGQGVLLGRNATEQQWHTALDRKSAGVVQRVVDSDRIPLLEYRDGELRAESGARLVIMPHFIAGSFAGASARYSTRTDVLNRIDFETVYSTLCFPVCE